MQIRRQLIVERPSSIEEVEHGKLVIITVIEADRTAVTEPEAIAWTYEEAYLVR